MLLPSELEARSLIPTLRALIAKRLVEAHGMTQQEAARRLGLTQPAISNYLRGNRATVFQWETSPYVQKIIHEITHLVARDPRTPVPNEKINEACLYIRQHRLMCDMHAQLEPGLDVETCHLCDQPLLEINRKHTRPALAEH